jgi:hypothetical protein
MVGPNRPFADQFPNHVIYALQFFHRWHIGSYTRSWAGCPDCIVVSGLPPDGEVFLLTSPLQKPSSIMDHRDLETQFGCSLGEELDLLSAVSLLVVLSAFINVSLTVL